MEHAELANALGNEANPRLKRLSKWSRANQHYRRRFAGHLAGAIAGHPALVFATSAKESEIIAAEVQFVRQLGLGDFLSRETVQGRQRVRLGPIVAPNSGDPEWLSVPEKQWPMLLFIVHFIARMHEAMCVGLKAMTDCVNWYFYADKPPAGDFSRAMPVLLGLLRSPGSIRWGYFLQGDAVETDLLADNLAGLLNEFKTHPSRYPTLRTDLTSHGGRGLLYWEHWERAK